MICTLAYSKGNVCKSQTEFALSLSLVSADTIMRGATSTVRTGRQLFEEQCRAIDRLYCESKFERFGVSNLPAHEVQTIYNILREGRLCTAERVPGRLQPDCARCGGTPGPDAAQARHRLLRLQFAWRRLFLQARRRAEAPKGSRMDEMSVFSEIYVSETRIKLLKNLKEACDRRGMAMKEATLRWFMHHSALGKEDGVILGASSAGAGGGELQSM
jgi:aflatoxin B1 aldehyde reductase